VQEVCDSIIGLWRAESESKSRGLESESDRVLNVRVQVRVLGIRVRVLKKGLESEPESLKIWTRLEYTVGLEYYITDIHRNSIKLI